MFILYQSVQSILCHLLMLRVQAGIIVVACSQCTRGSVDIDKYAVGRAFAEKGAGLLAVGRHGGH
jgi:L-asparaginase/Glu-tRNA(Gln) amidotransferase subunit D